MSASTTLLTFGSLQNDSTATSDLNQNFSLVNTALSGCLSLTGQAPNQMQATLDMNANRVINLPAPVSINEPMRLADATTLNGGGTVTVSQLPVGGTTGQVLTKNSNTNFDVGWITPSVNVTSGKTVNINNTLTFAGTDSTTITFQGTDTYVGRTTTDTFQNKTFNAAVSGNVLQINGTNITGVTGTGAAVLASTPSLSNPTFTGTVGGAPSYSGSNFISLSNIAQVPMYSILGNTATSTQNIASFTIGGLTNKASPVAGDYLLIQDNSSSPAGALKYATVSSIATAGSVSSIAGNTGAFTLGLGVTNSTNVIQLDPAYHRGALGGLNMSGGGSTTLTINQGYACDSTAAYMMKIGNFTKTGATWGLGSTFGALDTGSAFSTSTWYHVYVIARTDTGVVDIAFSTSGTAPTFGSNIPSAYTVYRRIGSFKTDSTPNIVSFSQQGDEFLWSTPVLDINATVVSSTASLLTLNSVPLGIKTNAVFNFTNSTSAAIIYISSPDTTDFATTLVADAAIGVNSASAGLYNYRTNTSQQLRFRAVSSSGTCSLLTKGWIDTRGRLT